MSDFVSPFLQKIDLVDKKNLALIYEDLSFTYEELIRLVKEKISLLKDIDKRYILGVRGDFDIDSISFLLACVELKRIVVTFIKDDKIDEKIREAGIYAIFEDKNLHFYKENENFKHKLTDKIISKSSSGLILFSSGSTGKPKAIVHSLDKLLSPFLDKKAKKMKGVFI